MEKDIRQARARMDLSNWDNLGLEMSHIRLVKACREMRESKMPLWYYRPLHPGSAPSEEEAETFCAWVYSSPAGRDLAQLLETP
jgi:Haem-binding domain